MGKTGMGNTIIGGLALAFALHALFLADSYAHDVLARAGIYAIAALGYQLVFGRLGALSLAQGCFFGLGAYAAGLTALETGLGFPLTLLAGMALPTLLAALVGVPVLRLGSHYFALATLGIAQLSLLVATNWTEVTGGANGLYGVPPVAVTFFGTRISADHGPALTGLIWGLVVAAFCLSRRLTAGRRGLAVETLREAPRAAAALGIDGAAIRYRFFVASAAFGGLAGALQAHTIGVVSPDVLSFHVLVLILAITVIGGRSSAPGTIAGALLLVHLPEWFRDFADYYLVVYGAALLIVIIFLPQGLAGLLPGQSRGERQDGSEVEQGRHSDTGAPPPAAPSPLVVEHLGKRFGGVTALDDVSLTLHPGGIVGLIGPNGSGKTTLVNVISGVERADTGRVRHGAATLTGAAPHHIARAGIIRTFQHPQIAPGLSVRESVAAAATGNVAEALHRTGLAGQADMQASALPPAARKHLEIARALAAGARILALDEPAAGMNEIERDALAGMLRALARDSGHTILVIDHAMDFLLPLADRVICLGAGRIVASGTPLEVARNRDAIDAYFGESPL